MSVERVAWPTPDALDENAARLRQDLARALRTYESRYELSSDRLESELAAGRLRETADVSAWVITLRAYRKLNGARPTRLE